MIFRYYILTGLFVVVNILSCFAQSNSETHPQNKYLILDSVSLNIYKFGKLEESSTKILALGQFAGNEFYFYLNNSSDSIFSNPIRFFKPSTDSILFWNDICPLLDYMPYASGSDTLFVYRYQWAIKKEAHDQAYIYCNPEHGLIALDLYHIGLIYFYEIPLIPKDIGSKLLNDMLKGKF